MGQDSNKKRLTHFTKPRQGTLGKMWQQSPHDGQASEDWLVNTGAVPETPKEPRASRSFWQRQPLPELPKWPPLPEEDPFAPGRLEEDGYTGEQMAPEWNPNQFDRPEQPTQRLLRRFWPTSRRRQIGLAVAAGVVIVLCSVISVAAIGHALNAPRTSAGNLTPSGGQNTAGQTAIPTTGQATPSTTVTSATDTPVPPLALTFTCASGSLGGDGQVCVHTAPNAAVSLAVKYCDGSYAKGKGLHGSAYTDSGGNYTWRWNITTGCAGTATATVTATSAGQTITQDTTFTITR
jgi:hypothetical protein